MSISISSLDKILCWNFWYFSCFVTKFQSIACINNETLKVTFVTVFHLSQARTAAVEELPPFQKWELVMVRRQLFIWWFINVLFLPVVELIFFTVWGSVLVLLKTVLIIQRCFPCCWVVLIESRPFLFLVLLQRWGDTINLEVTRPSMNKKNITVSCFCWTVGQFLDVGDSAQIFATCFLQDWSHQPQYPQKHWTCEHTL